MWEFWRSKWSKKPARRARGSESDSPYSTRSHDHAFNHPDLAAYNTPEHSKHIYFKDLKLPATDDSEEEDMHKHVARQKLVIVLVGLPGRGKTFLCNKLLCYLNWYAHFCPGCGDVYVCARRMVVPGACVCSFVGSSSRQQW